MKFKRAAQALGVMAVLTALSARANLVFNLIPDADTPQYAIDGFRTAASFWSEVIADDFTVNIRIGYLQLSSGVIGSTSSEFIERPYPDLRQALLGLRASADDYSSFAGLQTGDIYRRLINHTSNNPHGVNSATPYVDTMNRVGLTTANAKALRFLSNDGSEDATILFSSSFSFDFSHDSIEPGQIDFVGAAAHEIGHVLGFVSGVDDIDDYAGTSPGGDFSSNLVDLYRYSTLSLAEGAGVTDYTADTREKYFSVDGGTTEIALFATGVTYGDGRQASHWKDNLGLGLMDPTIMYGERVDIGLNDLRLVDVLGYTLVPEPAAGALLVVGLFVLMRFRKD